MPPKPQTGDTGTGHCGHEVTLVLDTGTDMCWTGHGAQVVLADLAKVDDIHWKMLTAARVETPEEEAIFSTLVCHYAKGPFMYY